MMVIKEHRLAEIHKRVAWAAEEGTLPWTFDRDDIYAIHAANEFYWDSYRGDGEGDDGQTLIVRVPDDAPPWVAEFIAHSPADVAYLLERVEKLEAALAEAQQGRDHNARCITEVYIPRQRKLEAVLEAAKEAEAYMPPSIARLHRQWTIITAKDIYEAEARKVAIALRVAIEATQ